MKGKNLRNTTLLSSVLLYSGAGVSISRSRAKLLRTLKQLIRGGLIWVVAMGAAGAAELEYSTLTDVYFNGAVFITGDIQGHWATAEEAEPAARQAFCDQYGPTSVHCTTWQDPRPVHCYYLGTLNELHCQTPSPPLPGNVVLHYEVSQSAVSYCSSAIDCYFIRVDVDPKKACRDNCVADPVNPANGSVIETIVDVPGIETALPFLRFYSSTEAKLGADPQGSILSPGWRHSYSRRILTTNTIASYAQYPMMGDDNYSPRYNDPASACVEGFTKIKSRVSTWAGASAAYVNNVCELSIGGTRIGSVPVLFANPNVVPPPALGIVTADVVRDNGQVVRFTSDGSSFIAPPGNSFKLEQSPLGFTLIDGSDAVEQYDVTGRLMSVTTRSGVVQTLVYDGSGRLASVTDSFGHTLALAYNANGRLEGISANGGPGIAYGYDGSNRLTSVTQSDGTSQSYVYAASPSIYLLQNRKNENNFIVSTWLYDSQSRATTAAEAGRGTHTFTYNVDGSVTVKDPLKAIRTFTYGRYGDQNRVIGISGSKCPTCIDDLTTTYDGSGYLSSRTDYNGNVTTYAYDAARGLPLSRTEAFGTPSSRTISTTWHSQYRLPLTKTEANTLTSYTHDAAGNILTRTVTDTSISPNISRTWTYTYNQFGKILTEDGPRTDVNDTTTYTYYDCATGEECGQLQSVTNALGQLTSFDSYNVHGQATRVTDANGVVTTLSFDSRQRMTDRCVGGELPGCSGGEKTHLDYWPTGFLRKVTLPDTSYLEYAYQSGGLLQTVADGVGNHIDYFYDAAGNKTGERVLDKDNVLSRAQSRAYNSLGQLNKIIGSKGTAAVTTTLTYDGNANVTAINAPLGRNTTQQFDELNRLKQVTDPGFSTTRYTYDTDDNLLSVEDGTWLSTQYQYNGFGDLLAQISPQTGTSTFAYDAAGNLLSSIDARTKATAFSYDSLNRLTQKSTTDQVIHYGYDAGPNGKGRLTSADDGSSSLAWSYDTLGRVVGRGQTIGGTTRSVGYGYANGNLVTVLTSSGQTITYGFNANHQVTSVAVNGALLVDNVLYEPFGPVRGWTWANSVTETRLHDADGNVSSISGSGQTSYQLDDASRITGITNVSSPDKSWQLGYDNMDRLVSASQSIASLTWTYDAVGNRQTLVGGNQPAYNSADINLGYNDLGRLSSYSGSTTVSYLYNALGERIQKTAATGVTNFVYDEDGHLLGEYSGAGDLIQETVWLGDIPLATIRPRIGGGIDVYYVHSDHLNTPRTITRSSDNAIVWRWETDPYGTAQADSNPSALGTFVYNLRYPGQYFDSESGLFYNYFRDYDPATGRYVESDPIGLLGGINTYAYVGGDPLGSIDPTGLAEPRTQPGTGVPTLFPPGPFDDDWNKSVDNTALAIEEWFDQAVNAIREWCSGDESESDDPMLAERETLSREEQEAVNAKNAGLPYDEAAYNRARQKQIKNEKYDKQRNKRKRGNNNNS